MPGFVEKVFWTGFTAWKGKREAALPYHSPEKLRRIQSRRIQSMVAFAYRTVPFYRAFMKENRLRPGDFRTADDLEKLPIVKNEDLSNTPEQFRSEAFADSEVLGLLTAGSTGLGKVIQHDVRAMFLARAGGHRNRKVISSFIGRSLGYKEVRVTSRVGTGQHVLGFYDRYSWVPGRVQLQRAMVHPEDTFEDNIRVINELEPDVIGGFGSYIGAIFQWAWTHGIPIHRPKLICYGGDLMHEPIQRIIETEYRVPVISRYQSCEALNIAFQCEQRKAFHVSVDQVVLRVVDSAGNTLPPGESGEIVISNLINRATVLLNYRMGDIGRLSTQFCSCGRNLPLLTRLQGRKNDLIRLSDGEVLHQSVIMPKLYSVPGVMQIQIRQKGLTEFLIKAVCGPGRNKEAVKTELADCFLETAGNPNTTSLEIEMVDAIAQEESGKFRSIISSFAD